VVANLDAAIATAEAALERCRARDEREQEVLEEFWSGHLAELREMRFDLVLGEAVDSGEFPRFPEEEQP
jgi:hypothetical protein